MTPKPKKTRESTKTTFTMEEMQSEMNSKLSSLIEKFELLEASLIAVTRDKEALKVGCPIFTSYFFSLRSETKQNRNRFASFSLCFAKQTQ